MASNHAMFASEVIDKSTVLGARDDELADIAVGIRSGAGDPALRSERMSWFPSGISSIAAGAVTLHRFVLDPVATTCGGRVFVVPVWS